MSLLDIRAYENNIRSRYLKGEKEDLGGIIEITPNTDYRRLLDIDMCSYEMEPMVNHEKAHYNPHYDYKKNIISSIKSDRAYDVLNRMLINRMTTTFIKIMRKHCLIIAGGSVGWVIKGVVSTTLNRADDIDIYPSQKTDIKKAIKDLATLCSHESCIFRTKHSVNFTLGKRILETRNMQLVAVSCDSVSQLIHLFDIPASACAITFDKDMRVFVTHQCLIQNFYETVWFDHNHVSFNYRERLEKYYRKGYNIVFPNYHGQLDGELDKFGKNWRKIKWSTCYGSRNKDSHDPAVYVINASKNDAINDHFCCVSGDDDVRLIYKGKSGENGLKVMHNRLAGIAKCARYHFSRLLKKYGMNNDELSLAVDKRSVAVNAFLEKKACVLKTISIAQLINDSIQLSTKEQLNSWYGKDDWKFETPFPIELEDIIKSFIPRDNEVNAFYSTHPYMIPPNTLFSMLCVRIDTETSIVIEGILYSASGRHARTNHHLYGNRYWKIPASTAPQPTPQEERKHRYSEQKDDPDDDDHGYSEQDYNSDDDTVYNMIHKHIIHKNVAYVNDLTDQISIYDKIDSIDKIYEGLVLHKGNSIFFMYALRRV